MPDAAKKWFQTTAIDYPNSRPHIGTAFEKIGADVQARYRRMEGYDVYFLMGNDENTVKVSQARRRAGPGRRRRTATTWPGSSARSGTRSTSATTTSSRPASARHHAVLPEVHPEGVRQRLHLQGRATRAGTATAARRSRPRRSHEENGGVCPNHKRAADPAQRAVLLLRAVGVPGPAAEATTRRTPTSSSRRAGATRSSASSKDGLQDVNITRHGRDLGHPRAVRPGVHDLRLVRRPADLHHRHRLRRRRGDVPQVLAGRRALHRQGHHAVPLRTLAGDADGRRASSRREQVFGHGFVYRKNEETGEVEKISKTLGNVVEPMEIITKFSAEAFRYYFMRECPFPGDGEFSWRAVRGGLQRRPGEQPRQPLQPRRDADHARTTTACSTGTAGRAPTPIVPGLDLRGVVGEVRGPRRGVPSTTRRCRRSGCRSSTRPTSTSKRTQPWKLVKTDKDAAKEVLFNLCESLRVGGDPAQAVPAAVGRDDLHELQLRRRRGRRCSTPTPASAGCSAEDLRVMAELDDGKVKPLFPRIG